MAYKEVFIRNFHEIILEKLKHKERLKCPKQQLFHPS